MGAPLSQKKAKKKFFWGFSLRIFSSLFVSVFVLLFWCFRSWKGFPYLQFTIRGLTGLSIYFFLRGEKRDNIFAGNFLFLFSHLLCEADVKGGVTAGCCWWFVVGGFDPPLWVYNQSVFPALFLLHGEIICG